MKTVNVGYLGITISHCETNKNNASISSNMKMKNTEGNAAFNLAVAHLESLILGHFIAGVDVTSQDYQTGVMTMYESLKDLAEDLHDESGNGIVRVQKYCRVNAIVDQSITYDIKKSDWTASLDEHGDEKDALDALISDKRVTCTLIDNDVDEVNAEFDVNVERLS